MSESCALLPVSDRDEVQQGDLFRILGSLEELGNAEAQSEWCLILTADCDIAQNKLDSCFTVLSVVSAGKWLEVVWADEKVDQAIAKGISDLSAKIWAHDKKRDPSVSRLSKEVAHRFVMESTPSKIEEVFAPDKQFAQSVTKNVGALKDLLDCQRRGENLAGWIRWRKFIGGSDKSISSDIREAFSNMRGGYFFLPELPGHPLVGHVVLLREIRVAPIASVFRRSIDIRNTKVAPPYFLRRGRLSDNVRFAIAQQVATLFSRVGLPSSFEDECEHAKEAASEEALSRLELANV